jgi:hypothetical protein
MMKKNKQKRHEKEKKIRDRERERALNTPSPTHLETSEGSTTALSPGGPVGITFGIGGGDGASSPIMSPDSMVASDAALERQREVDRKQKQEDKALKVRPVPPPPLLTPVLCQCYPPVPNVCMCVRACSV